MSPKIDREVPEYEIKEYSPRRNKYALLIFVLNEKGRLQSELGKMKNIADLADIIIADGGSTDGGTDIENLKDFSVRAILTKKGPGKLGAQIRMGFDYILNQNYEGVITVDGNDKDDVNQGVPYFIEGLQKGLDHIQGSRFIAGGFHQNTPLSRLLAVRIIHAPLIRWASGFAYTDTTNGFRAYSRRLLESPKLAIFRNELSGYELHYYLAIESARQKFRITEVPVSRVYPNKGPTPTKISPLKGNAKLLWCLIKTCLGAYRPSRKV